MRQEIGQFGGPLDAPFGNRAHEWSARAGLLFRIRDRAGRVGLGEASPLPGYSPDTIEYCIDVLHAVELPDEFDPSDIPTLAARVPATAPAARFAVETALYDIAGKRRGAPVSALLSDRARAPVGLNATCSSVGAALDAYRRGIRAFKVKVGRPGALEAEVGLLHALREHLGPGVALRADANRAWTVREATDALAALAPIGLEYVEEPVVAGACLDRAPVRLALDESLADGDWTIGSASVLVLKPMLLGGFHRCLELSRLGVDVVVSHLVDGPIALAACAELALAIGGRMACGLDRHVGLSAWPLIEVPTITDSHIVPTDRPGLGIEL